MKSGRSQLPVGADPGSPASLWGGEGEKGVLEPPISCITMGLGAGEAKGGVRAPDFPHHHGARGGEGGCSFQMWTSRPTPDLLNRKSSCGP